MTQRPRHPTPKPAVLQRYVEGSRQESWSGEHLTPYHVWRLWVLVGLLQPSCDAAAVVGLEWTSVCRGPQQRWALNGRQSTGDWQQPLVGGCLLEARL